ncbi:MerR family transcriptional regulator [Neobacillus drentensis]|uniref:MerR family transcriptional regulator n=1 Tax=Neobacillus drentensis TaxID=220684 RepID=UPI003003995B
MNTSEVAKLLGVSTSTIQRWVKQLELPMERNERGHYHFSNEDIEVLKKIHEQLQNGTLIQEITPLKEKKVPRKGAIKIVEDNQELEKLNEKVSKLEIELHSKADSVVSYQLLQHRREIEELQIQVNELTKQLDQFQKLLSKVNLPSQIDDPIVFDSSKGKRKKKNIVSSLLGFL